MENSLEVRNMKDLEAAFSEADNVIMKNYMRNITSCKVQVLSDRLATLDTNSVVRMNKIDKLVYDVDENNQDKLMNVYNSVGLCGGSIINVVISDGKSIEYFVGTRAKSVNDTAACQTALTSTFKGNFPGTTLVPQKKSGLMNCVDKIFGGTEENRVVSFVSGIPGYKNEANRHKENFVQGIERVIDTMQGKKYALVTIAEPVDAQKIALIREGYENLYTQLSPFVQTQLTYSESDSNAVAESLTTGITQTMSESISNTVSNSTSSTTGNNRTESVNIGGFAGMFGVGGVNVSKGTSWGTSNSNTIQNGYSQGNTSSASNATSDSKGTTNTYTSINGRTMQITMNNRTVKSMLDKIDKLLERIENSEELGLWNTATYCIAEDSQTSMVLGNAMEALCRGEETSIETFVVDTWMESLKSEMVKEYLKRFVHPELTMSGNLKEYFITPASLINGRELVVEAGLPQKSVSGLAVSEMTAFSRNVVFEKNTDEKEIELGKIYHMGECENMSVTLDVSSLASHMLITGSTGSGKSNTVYHLLNQLMKQEIKFLVIEPAKGEYKNVFGNRKDVSVLGTNEKFTELLRINPFRFPKSVHVLEHIDRLIEIFNVCWPMYAAMPAVLKDAVLCAYESCGWDLEESENVYDEELYPSFKDLQRELINVIERSAYSEEVKGNYIGSLVTRVKSLTNGINGKIFSSDDIDYTEIFDVNTIIDLSRVGSVETKSLIMGVLVLALNEYRMAQSNCAMNQKLKHVTVLEEAHNLLRRNIGPTSEDGSNIAGKSVEMITNSIAEMRTYGEGFIIVDQSPNAIDISAIRNTNTKIIMRLPEENDRIQAGKSAALKDNQIDELAKLARGVAVVYQNNWLDPVLCSINKANIEEVPYVFRGAEKKQKIDFSDMLKLLMKNRVDERIECDIDKIESDIKLANISARTKIELKNIVHEIKAGNTPAILKEEGFKRLSDVVVDILNCNANIQKYSSFNENCDLLQQELDREIRRNAWNMSKEMHLAISQCILRQLVECDNEQIELYSNWREYAIEQRKLV